MLAGLDKTGLAAAFGLSTFVLGTGAAWVFKWYKKRQQDKANYAAAIASSGGGSGSGSATQGKKNKKKGRNLDGGTLDGEDLDGQEAMKVKGEDLKKLLQAVKLLNAPLLAVSFLWTLASDKAAVLAAVPALFSSYGGELQKVLPLHAKNLSEAFQLGNLFKEAQGLTAGSDALRAVLEKVSSLCGRPNVTLEQLLALPVTLAEQDGARGPFQKITAVFSIVNLIWLISILGLSATIGPFLWILAAPLRKWLVSIWTDAIIPLLKKLKWVFMYIFYGLSCYIIVESLRYPADAYSMTGTMLGITGLCGLTLSWFYNTYLLSDGGGHLEIWAFLSSFLLLGTALPVSYLHQSTICGYLSVLGLLLTCFWSGVPFIFQPGARDYSIHSLLAGCAFTGLLNAFLKALHVNNDWLGPLQPAVGFASTAIYLNTLMFCCFDWRRFINFYDGLFISHLLVFFGAGELLAIPNMVSTAKAYAVLYGFFKFIDHGRSTRGPGFIVSLFTGFGILYGISLYVSRHPELIGSLFSV